ncbi:MAG TPA: amidophosphoribosyltransferase [Sulfurovum sp.]|nr:MAG: amidophosphoribosyltransferase [Sulfurovum sp. 35-42-20]OYZ26267.1 MAG: amidophosphoribosyltransferase [Sulfurovum sp. 16-42-52]OYZ48075.1 MAG: amidophosphoribosyltransferase [Sulfurovum sp. 24-42-9]OZA46555.1 MAG: amidophosphoribosyltransferase [Sulfurovum sp. 17-42-90]OZA60823.1 MAG: amidophosphoribosyltransferase [Sulfurovum sp. 39-42-12]HQR74484.1 amidophosphoribosyltransferase [Sulfurovum sp.]
MCAIVGVFGVKKASTVAYYSLFSMQHRGQEATGISASDGEKISIYKKRGMVADVFSQDILDDLQGECAVGHNRYSTAGSASVGDSQPVFAKYKLGEISVVHNGNLINKQEVRNQLIDKGAIFQTDMDTENIIHLIAKSQKDSLVDRIKDMLSRIEGAYCLAIQSRSKMFVIRDRFGIRPLSLGKFKDGGYIVASETCAFDLVGAEFIRDVAPGEMLIFEEGKEPLSEQVFEADFHPCAFEYIYFARPDSIIDSKNVYQMRLEMGRRLAQEVPAEVDLVLPVPDSGVAAARGYAEGLGVPFEMGIVRNHYVGRTFIEPTQAIRDLKVKLKLSPVKHLIAGKRVAIIDDSLVRGTTSKQIVRMLLDAGAKEVHMRIASPEIKFPCRYGIDTPTQMELISSSYGVDEIAHMIGASSLGFLSIDGLKASLGKEQNYSLVSFDGNYFAGGSAESPGCSGSC